MLQFTMSSAVLSATLADLTRVINKRASMPILENVRISMDGTGRIEATAMYDNTIRMVKILQANRFAGQGVILANAEILANSIKGLPEQDITLTCEKEELHIHYNDGSTGFLVNTNDDDYPQATEREKNIARVYIQGKTLVEGISRVQYAIARDDTRPIMTGVFMERVGDRLTFAASDGRVLKYTDYTPDFESNDFSAILPPRVCDIIRASVKPGNQVLAQIGNSYIYLEYGNTILEARLIEGRYPNYRAVVPAANPYHIETDRQALLASVKRVGLFANSSSNLMELRLSQGQLSVIGRDDDLFGRSLTETIAIEDAWSDKGLLPDPLRIGLSATFFAAVLQNFGSESVELQIADPSRAVKFAGDSATTILMPMMLEEKKAEDISKREEQARADEEIESINLDDKQARADVEAALAERNAAVAAERERWAEIEAEANGDGDEEEETDELDAALAAGPDNVDMCAVIGALNAKGEARLSDYARVAV